MATFSKIENNIVVKIVEVSDNIATTEQNGINFLKNLYKDSEAQWVQTHTDGTRKNFAGIGYTYNLTEDAFIPKKPYPSWVLKKPEYIWESPVGDPPLTYTKNLTHRDGETPLGDLYAWNEVLQKWEIRD